MRFYIKIGEDTKEHEIRNVFLVGRQQGDLLFENDTKISKLHLKIFINQGDPYLEDLGSSNGTLLNDILVSPHEPILLNAGDLIQVGDVILCFQSQEVEDQDKTRIEVSPIDTLSAGDRTVVAPARALFNEAPKKQKKTAVAMATELPISETTPDNGFFNKGNFVEIGLLLAAIIGTVLIIAKPDRNKEIVTEAPEIVQTKTSEVDKVIEVAKSKPVEAAKEVEVAKELQVAKDVQAVKTVEVFAKPEIAAMAAPIEFASKIPVEKKSVTVAKSMAKPRSVHQQKKAIPKVATLAHGKTRTTLLGRLEAIKFQYKKAKSLRVKTAIYLDARDLVSRFFTARRTAIVRDVQQTRGPASTVHRSTLDAKHKIEKLRMQEQKYMSKLQHFFDN